MIARLLEFGGAEYMLLGLGYAKSLRDLGDSVITTTADVTPIRVCDVGQVVPGSDYRRGVADLDSAADSSCRRWMKARCSTCPPPCLASPSPKRNGCCRQPIG